MMQLHDSLTFSAAAKIKRYDLLSQGSSVTSLSDYENQQPAFSDKDGKNIELMLRHQEIPLWLCAVSYSVNMS